MENRLNRQNLDKSLCFLCLTQILANQQAAREFWRHSWTVRWENQIPCENFLWKQWYLSRCLIKVILIIPYFEFPARRRQTRKTGRIEIGRLAVTICARLVLPQPQLIVGHVALTIVQPGKGIFLSEDLCSKDNVWPPTLITGTRLSRTSPKDHQRPATVSRPSMSRRDRRELVRSWQSCFVRFREFIVLIRAKRWQLDGSTLPT